MISTVLVCQLDSLFTEVLFDSHYALAVAEISCLQLYWLQS